MHSPLHLSTTSYFLPNVTNRIKMNILRFSAEKGRPPMDRTVSYTEVFSLSILFNLKFPVPVSRLDIHFQVPLSHLSSGHHHHPQRPRPHRGFQSIRACGALDFRREHRSECRKFGLYGKPVFRKPRRWLRLHFRGVEIRGRFPSPPHGKLKCPSRGQERGD